MNFLGRKPVIKGQIGSYKLENWWVSTFSEEERKHIESTYTPFALGAGAQTGILTQGEIYKPNHPIGLFLSELSSWFKKTPQDRDISRRILNKAIEVSDPNKDIIPLHFIYSALVQTWYRDRDTLPQALDETIKACQSQISLAAKAAKQFKKEYPNQPLPRHVGYGQLIIIYKKQKRYDDMIEVARHGMKNWPEEGWEGVIEEAERKKAKGK